jgi:hypothetical protein
MRLTLLWFFFPLLIAIGREKKASLHYAAASSAKKGASAVLIVA